MMKKANKLIKCACGCGNLRDRYDKRGKEKKYIQGHYANTKKFFIDEKELRRLYLDEKISSLKIAKKYNVQKITILRRLKDYNIKRRTTSEALTKNICGKNHPMWGKKHKQESKEMMKESRKKGIEEGRIKIWCEGLTKETDERLNFERPTKFKVGDVRILGENNTNFNNWSSFEPYGKEFNKKLKTLVRKRDNQICMLCGIHREQLNYAFSVHHINYDKQCNLLPNLISLCKKCHVITNNNRKYWINFFQVLLSDKYNYKYKNQDIVLEVKNEI